jgi:hypothetical protein
LPDSCTHIAGQCSHHTNHIISRHNAACQLTHAAIRTAFKGGGTIYSPHDLRLVSTDAGSKHQAIEDDLEAFTFPPSQDQEYHSQKQQQQPPLTTDWLNQPTQSLQHIIQLTISIYNTQTNKLGYLMINTPSATLHPHIQDWLGPTITLDGPPCGSGAHRPTRCRQNLVNNSATQTKFNNLPTPTLTINARLEQANIQQWRTQPTIPLYHRHTTTYTHHPLPPHIALPKITCHLNSPAFRTQAGIPGTCLLYYKDTLSEPSATIKEHLMGFHQGAKAAPGLSETDRCQILGQAPDINILTWLITQATLTTQTQKLTTHTALTQLPNIDPSLPTLPSHNNTTKNTTQPQPTATNTLATPSQPRGMDIHRRLAQRWKPQTRSISYPLPHKHDNLYRRIRARGDAHHHESRTRGHIRCPRYI